MVVATGAVLAAGSVAPLRARVVGARGDGGRDGCHGLGIGVGVHGAATATATTTTAGGQGAADHQGHEAVRQRLATVRPVGRALLETKRRILSNSGATMIQSMYSWDFPRASKVAT